MLPEVDEAQVELRLLDEETLQASAQQSSDNQSSTVVTGIKCQLVIALLGLLALIPLIGIVVYLVGMFINVPDTQ